MIDGADPALLGSEAMRAERKPDADRPPASREAPCEQCAIWNRGVCRHVSRRDFDRLFPYGARVQVRKAGTALFHQGEPFDHVLIVRSGWVMTHKVFEDGQRQIIRFALPGDLVGFEGDEASGMAYGAETVTDVMVCGVKHATFFRVCAGSPQLAMNFATAVTREALSAWNHLGALGQQTAQGRIANLLLELHRRVTAREGAESVAVHLPLSQVHIADATGLTPVHVCRTLKQMRLEGLLEFRKGQLVLLDPHRLAALAQLAPDVRLACPSPASPLAVA